MPRSRKLLRTPVLSPRDKQRPSPEVCSLLRLIAYKIRQLELLEKSEGPGGADFIRQISASLYRERTYAETIPISQTPTAYEEALLAYYLLLEERLSHALEKGKKDLAEQILIHQWRTL